MREEDGCREGKKRGGEKRWEYICGGQCCETRQVAVTLKMTVIKVTAGRWIWWFWLANQSSVKRTTAQIQRPPDTFWLMPVPDKKGPLTVLLLNWVKWQKMLFYPTPLFWSLFHLNHISFYMLCPRPFSSFPTVNVPLGVITGTVGQVGIMLIVEAYLYVCACVHWMRILYLSSVLPLESIDQ